MIDPAAIAAPGMSQRGEIDVVVHDERDLHRRRQSIDDREPIPDQVRRIPRDSVLRVEDAGHTNRQRHDRNAAMPRFPKHQPDRLQQGCEGVAGRMRQAHVVREDRSR